jgi:hypothetical protein
MLSRAEVLYFHGCVENIKHNAILITCYAAGLRISEAAIRRRRRGRIRKRSGDYDRKARDAAGWERGLRTVSEAFLEFSGCGHGGGRHPAGSICRPRAFGSPAPKFVTPTELAGGICRV